MNWHVYIILCSDGSLYTGITTDPVRRFRQHADGSGAKYFRGRQPLRIVYQECDHNRSTAGKRELQIKQLTHADKCVFVSHYGKAIFENLTRLPDQRKPTRTCRKGKHAQQ